MYDLGTLTICPKESMQQTSMVQEKSLNLHNSPQGSTTLGVSEYLQQELGFTETQSFHSPLILRGVGGHRLLIVRDGMRLEDSYPSGYKLHTENSKELQTLTVHKGMTSVRYGAGAMAGIIHMESQKIPRYSFYKSFLNLGLTSNAHERSLNNQILWGSSTVGIILNTRARQADEYHYGNGSKAENTFFQDWDVSATVQWYPHQNHTLQYRYSYHEGGPWGKPQGFTGTSFLIARVREENHHRHHIQYQWLGPSHLEIQIDGTWNQEVRSQDFLYLNAGTRENSYRETTLFDFETYHGKLQLQKPLSRWWLFSLGSQLSQSTISSPLYVTDYYENLQFRNRQRDHAQSASTGFFTESDWKLPQQWFLRTGLRWDFYQLEEGNVFDTSQTKPLHSTMHSSSALLSLQKKWSPQHCLNITLARSFRVPHFSEMFGQSINGNGLIYGNPDLKPEKGLHLDIGWQLTNPTGTWYATPFLWWMNQMIVKEIRPGRGITYAYQNAAHSRLWGAEAYWASPAFPLHRQQLTIKLGGAWVQGQDIGYGEMPPVRLQFSSQFSPRNAQKGRWNSGVSVNYYPELSHQFTLDLFLSVPLGHAQQSPLLDIQIKNALNACYTPYLSLVPVKGRDIRANLRINL